MNNNNKNTTSYYTQNNIKSALNSGINSNLKNEFSRAMNNGGYVNGKMMTKESANSLYNNGGHMKKK